MTIHVFVSLLCELSVYLCLIEWKLSILVARWLIRVASLMKNHKFFYNRKKGAVKYFLQPSRMKSYPNRSLRSSSVNYLAACSVVLISSQRSCVGSVDELAIVHIIHSTASLQSIHIHRSATASVAIHLLDDLDAKSQSSIVSSCIAFESTFTHSVVDKHPSNPNTVH